MIKAVFLEDSSDMGMQDKLEGLDYQVGNHLEDSCDNSGGDGT